MRGIRMGGLVVALTSAAMVARSAQKSSIDTALAKQYFDEAKALCDRDGGKLWGRTLHGPLMFADNATRAVVANRPDAEGKLQARDGVYVGVLPDSINIANTAVTFASVKWTMVMWPPPGDPAARGLLMVHELWHRVQDDLGFPSAGPANDHLDTRDGRTWMRLEWAALRTALQSEGDARKNAATDALVFRAHRRSLFPSAAKQERELEMHEGLANYTGAAVAAANTSEQIANALRELDAGEKKPTFVRSFAYASGPAYGVLLDDLAPKWRQGLTPRDDLGDLLGRAIGINAPGDAEGLAEKAAGGYESPRIFKEEDAREEVRQRKLADARAKFVDGPVLRLPFVSMKIKLDPDGLIPLGDLGTIYPTARIVDAWGVLDVTDGALIDNQWSGVIVALPASPDGQTMHGSGWALQLSQDWKLAPGRRNGDMEIRRSR